MSQLQQPAVKKMKCKLETQAFSNKFRGKTKTNNYICFPTNPSSL